jgi:hypothetical protein
MVIDRLEQDFGMAYQLLLIMGTEMIGYGLAGICRRWLVYPSDMIWPRVLQSCNFLNAMHQDKNYPVGRWTISRYRLFFLSAICMFGYSFLPQLIPFLGSLDFITPIWPDSKIVNILFGNSEGLGLLPLTLSYQTIVSFLGSPQSVRVSRLGPPQVVPAWAHVNILGGMIFWFWIVAGIFYAKNYWYSQYFPVAS